MSGVEDARIKATYPGDESAHRQRLASAEAELVSARKRIAQLTEELRSVESERQSLTGKLKELNSKQDEVDQLLQVLEPQIRCVCWGRGEVKRLLWGCGREEGRRCGCMKCREPFISRLDPRMRQAELSSKGTEHAPCFPARIPRF